MSDGIDLLGGYGSRDNLAALEMAPMPATAGENAARLDGNVGPLDLGMSPIDSFAVRDLGVAPGAATGAAARPVAGAGDETPVASEPGPNAESDGPVASLGDRDTTAISPRDMLQDATRPEPEATEPRAVGGMASARVTTPTTRVLGAYELMALASMPARELRRRFCDVFDAPPPTRRRDDETWLRHALAPHAIDARVPHGRAGVATTTRRRRPTRRRLPSADGAPSAGSRRTPRGTKASDRSVCLSPPPGTPASGTPRTTTRAMTGGTTRSARSGRRRRLWIADETAGEASISIPAASPGRAPMPPSRARRTPRKCSRASRGARPSRRAAGRWPPPPPRGPSPRLARSAPPAGARRVRGPPPGRQGSETSDEAATSARACATARSRRVRRAPRAGRARGAHAPPARARAASAPRRRRRRKRRGRARSRSLRDRSNADAEMDAFATGSASRRRVSRRPSVARAGPHDDTRAGARRRRGGGAGRRHPAAAVGRDACHVCGEGASDCWGEDDDHPRHGATCRHRSCYGLKASRGKWLCQGCADAWASATRRRGWDVRAAPSPAARSRRRTLRHTGTRDPRHARARLVCVLPPRGVRVEGRPRAGDARRGDRHELREGAAHQPDVLAVQAGGRVHAVRDEEVLRDVPPAVRTRRRVRDGAARDAGRAPPVFCETHRERWSAAARGGGHDDAGGGRRSGRGRRPRGRRPRRQAPESPSVRRRTRRT